MHQVLHPKLHDADPQPGHPHYREWLSLEMQDVWQAEYLWPERFWQHCGGHPPSAGPDNAVPIFDPERNRVVDVELRIGSEIAHWIYATLRAGRFGLLEVSTLVSREALQTLLAECGCLIVLEGYSFQPSAIAPMLIFANRTRAERAQRASLRDPEAPRRLNALCQEIAEAYYTRLYRWEETLGGPRAMA